MSGNRAEDSGLVDEVVADLRRERPDLDVAAIETVCRLIYVGRKMEFRAERVLKPVALNYTDYDVLCTLRRSGAPLELNPADLLRAAMITSGAMSSCLDRLEKARLIRRRVSKQDRRMRCVSLTPTGKRLVEDVLTERNEDARMMIRQLCAADVANLNRLLRAVIDADQAAANEGAKKSC